MLSNVCKTTQDCTPGASCIKRGLNNQQVCTPLFGNKLPDMSCNITSDCLGYQKCVTGLNPENPLMGGICQTYGPGDKILGGDIRDMEMRLWLNRTVEGSDFANQRKMISNQQMNEQRAAIQRAADRAAAVAEGIKRDEYMRSPAYARDQAELAELRRTDADNWAKIERERPWNDFKENPMGFIGDKIDEKIEKMIGPGWMHAL